MPHKSFKTLALALALTATLAAAADPAHAQQDRKAMVKLSKEASALFREGKYEEAAKKFREAHDKAPEPTLLKNGMIAWYKADRCLDAIIMANSYLLTKPTDQDELRDTRTILFDCHLSAADASLAKGDLEDAKLQIEKASEHQQDQDLERLADAQRALADARAAQEKAAQDKAAQDKAAQEKAVQEDDPVLPPKKPESSSGGATIAGWSLVGAGAVGLVATAFYANGQQDKLATRFDELRARSEDNELYECSKYPDAATRGDCDAVFADARRARTISIVGYTASGLALVGGAALLYLSLSAEAPEPSPAAQATRARWFPILAPGQAGVGMSLAF